jgi:hypothetical protein
MIGATDSSLYGFCLFYEYHATMPAGILKNLNSVFFSANYKQRSPLKINWHRASNTWNFSSYREPAPFVEQQNIFLFFKN